MKKEELDVLKQRLRKRIELPYPANIAEAVNLSNELQTVIKALEQAQAEIGSYIDEKFWMEKRLERYRQLLNDTVGEINNVYLRKRICDMLEGAE